MLDGSLLPRGLLLLLLLERFHVSLLTGRRARRCQRSLTCRHCRDFPGTKLAELPNGESGKPAGRKANSTALSCVVCLVRSRRPEPTYFPSYERLRRVTEQ